MVYLSHMVLGEREQEEQRAVSPVQKMNDGNDQRGNYRKFKRRDNVSEFETIKQLFGKLIYPVKAKQ